MKQFGIQQFAKRDDDEPLNALLRQWAGVETTVDFDEAVWRKIRDESIPRRFPAYPHACVEGWSVSRMGRLTAAAVAAAVVVGVGLGLVLHRTPSGRPVEYAFAQPHTVAEAYFTLVSGGLR